MYAYCVVYVYIRSFTIEQKRSSLCKQKKVDKRYTHAIIYKVYGMYKVSQVKLKQMYQFIANIIKVRGTSRTEDGKMEHSFITYRYPVQARLYGECWWGLSRIVKYHSQIAYCDNWNHIIILKLFISVMLHSNYRKVYRIWINVYISLIDNKASGQAISRRLCFDELYQQR